MTKTHKQMMQQFSHGDGKQWLRNLIALHQRQIADLERYVEQFEVASTNEMSATLDTRIPTTTNVLSWAANTLSFIPTNARVDLLPNITAAIVIANAHKE